MKELAILRRRAGLAQTDLAQRTGIHAATICRAERGQLTLRPEQLEAIRGVIATELAAWLRTLDSEAA